MSLLNFLIVILFIFPCNSSSSFFDILHLMFSNRVASLYYKCTLPVLASFLHYFLTVYSIQRLITFFSPMLYFTAFDYFLARGKLHSGLYDIIQSLCSRFRRLFQPPDFASLQPPDPLSQWFAMPVSFSPSVSQIVK